MKADHGLALPRRLQIEFSQAIQKITDGEAVKCRQGDVGRLPAEYRRRPGRWSESTAGDGSEVDGGIDVIEATVNIDGAETETAVSNGPLAAFVDAPAPSASTSACWTTPRRHVGR